MPGGVHSKPGPLIVFNLISKKNQKKTKIILKSYTQFLNLNVNLNPKSYTRSEKHLLK